MRRSLPLLAVSMTLAACAGGTGRFGRVSDVPILFPPPPDTARIQFLLAVSNEDDVRGVKNEGWFASVLEETNRNTAGIIKPYGVSLRGSRIYVCDTMLPGVHILDMERRSFRMWRPSGPGTLRKPINCVSDPATGELFVTDTERQQVVVFDSTLAYEDAFGEGHGTPTDVFVADDRIWVADIRDGKVHAYDRNTYEYLMSFPADDAEGDAVLRQPTNLWVHGDTVVVSDFGDFGVKLYTTDGTFLRKIGSFGRGLGQFVRPKGVAVDPEGRIYVVDAGFENVQIFDPEGRLLMFFGGSYSGPGTMWLPAQITITQESLERFQEYVEPGYVLRYLILVTNQYGPDRLTIYGFVEPGAPGAP